MFAPHRSARGGPPGNAPTSTELGALPRDSPSNARHCGPPLRALPSFHVRVAERDGVRVVEVEGEIDILTVPTLAVALDDDHARVDAMVLDLAKTRFVSSSGLRLIVASHRRLSRRGGFALAGVQPNVAHVIEIVGLANALLIAADVAAAMRLLDDRDD